MNSGDKFGIEIETVGASKEAIARAIQSVVGGTVSTSYDGAAVTMADGRIWNVVRDGSLSGGSLNGEVVSPILVASEIEILQNIVRAIRGVGAKADESCGIHIHVDGSRFDVRSLTNLVRLVARRESSMMRSFGVSERRSSHYTKTVDQDFIRRLDARKPTCMGDLKRAWYGNDFTTPSRYHGSRYHGLNLNSFFFRGTVEFRYFNGTLHAGEVKAYVQFVLSLAATACAKKSVARKGASNLAERTEFQYFMYGLGMKGEQFETARLHLTKRLDKVARAQVAV